MKLQMHQIIVLSLVVVLSYLTPSRAEQKQRSVLKPTIGPEFKVMQDGLRPYMFVSRAGTIFVQAQLPTPDGDYPGRWGAVRSGDGGATWQDWSTSPEQGPGPFIEGSVTQLRDGTILLLDSMAHGPSPDGHFIGQLWESNDEMKTIAGPAEARIYLPEGKGGFDDLGRPVDCVFLHRTLTELPDGDLLATAYGWFKEDTTPSSYESHMNRTRSILLRSKDRGRNWTLVSTIAVDPTVGEEGFNEPVLLRVSGGGVHQGRLIALMRVGSNFRVWPNPVHQAESDDQGVTWSKPRPLAFNGVNPDLIELSSGALVAGFGWRTKESRQKVEPGQPRRLGPEHGNYIALSFDQGDTWSQVTQVTGQGTTAYVTVREVKPNRLLLVYDQQGEGERVIMGRFIDLAPLE